MQAVLLDTDVFSFAVKRDSRAAFYASELQSRETFLSFMTVAELRRWGITHRWGAARRNELEAAIAQCHVVMADDRMCTVWAETMAHRARNGRPMGTADAWIAATALRFNITLVSHNADDFQDIPGLAIITRSR